MDKYKRKVSFRMKLTFLYVHSWIKNKADILMSALWVGKQSASRRYNRTTFAAVKPWRINQELAVQDLPIFL